VTETEAKIEGWSCPAVRPVAVALVQKVSTTRTFQLRPGLNVDLNLESGLWPYIICLHCIELLAHRPPLHFNWSSPRGRTRRRWPFDKPHFRSWGSLSGSGSGHFSAWAAQ